VKTAGTGTGTAHRYKLELELKHTHMRKKSLLWVEVGARAVRKRSEGAVCAVCTVSV
jgi:hypothetical protein